MILSKLVLSGPMFTVDPAFTLPTQCAAETTAHGETSVPVHSLELVGLVGVVQNTTTFASGVSTSVQPPHTGCDVLAAWSLGLGSAGVPQPAAPIAARTRSWQSGQTVLLVADRGCASRWDLRFSNVHPQSHDLQPCPAACCVPTLFRIAASCFTSETGLRLG